MINNTIVRLLSLGIVLGSLLLPAGAQAVAATDLDCTGCVGTRDIANVSVTNAKLGNNAVNAAKISDGSIINADINATAGIDPTKISGTAWTTLNDGSLTGLDADLLDGLTSSQLLRSDADTALAGSITITGNSYVSGNVGIGITNPGKKFEVVGDVMSRSSSGIATAGILAADGYGLNLWTNPSYDSSSPDSGWTRDMTINGGSVGIGTTAPTSKFSVVAGSDTWSGAFYGSSTSDQVRLGTYGGTATIGANNSTGSAWANLALNPGGGNVGIGTSSPSATLDVTGDLYVSGAAQLGAAMVFPSPDIADHGNPDTAGSIAWYVVRLADIGGVIYLQPGTYYVDSQAIPLADNLAIIGSGPGSKIVATANLTDDLINNESEALGELGVRNVTLKDFVLTGNHYTDWYSGLGGPGDYQDCIDIGGITTEADYNTNISLSGLIVSDCGEMGIVIKHTDELTMSDIFLYDNGTSDDYHHNIYLSEMNNAMLNNIQTIGAAGNGIKISHVNRATLTNIIARNNDRYGIRVDADSNQVSIASSSAYDNGASGFYFMTDGGGAYDATLSGCTAYGNTDHGLKIDHSDNISVTGCIIRDNDIDGIHLEGADNITMTGNSVRDNNDDGLDLDASSDNTIFVGNINVGNGDDDVSGTVTVKDLNI